MHDRDSSLDALQGWLLLLPLLALALPVSANPFTGAPDTVAIGAGAVLLGALPALVLSALRAFRNRADVGLAAGIPLGAPLLLAPLALGAYGLEDAVDPFNAWRALVGLCGGAAYFMAGATLGLTGRRVLLRGLPVTTLLLLASAFLAEDSEPGNPTYWTGVLGNTGDLSEAMLPGAVMGAGAFLTAEGALGFLGFAALLGYAAYAGLVPVHAGAVALAVTFVVVFAASALARSGGEHGRQAAARRSRLLMVATLVAALTTFGRGAFGPSEDDGPPAAPSAADAPAPEASDGTAEPADASGTTGGVRFRLLTWAAVWNDMLPTVGAEGVGPGQFQAAFPRFRDPEEIELSSHGRRETTPQEVEHAHDDPLTALAEYGYLGGGAFALLLLLIAVRAVRSVAGEERAHRDFCAAALAMVTASLFNAPLLYAPLSHAVAFLAFGVVAAPALDAPRTHGKAGLAAQVLVLVAAGLLAPKAVELVRYGRAMAEVPDATITTSDDRVRLHETLLARTLDRALEIAPDAVQALEKRAELLRRTGAPMEQRLEAHRALLARRPDSVAALINLSSVLGAGGAYEAAAEPIERAGTLDPDNPMVLQNRARLAFDLRDAAAFERALDELAARRPLDEAYLRRYANEALVGCRQELAAVVVPRYRQRRGQPPLSLDDLNAVYAAAEAADAADDETMRTAYRALFDHAMALDNLRRGATGSAVTKARLAYQRARDAGVDTGATRLRLAAAHAAAGDTAAARAVLDEGPLRRSDGAAMAPEEREALVQAGLLGGSSAGGR